MLKIVAALFALVVVCSAQKSVGSYPYLGGSILSAAPIQYIPSAPMNYLSHPLAWNNGFASNVLVQGPTTVNHVKSGPYVRPLETYGMKSIL